MRLAFFPLLVCGALATNAFATDLYQNYIILEASNLSPVGGTFSLSSTLGGGTNFGTFSGTFSVDMSDLPTAQGPPVSLGSADFKTTTFGSFHGSTYTSGTIVVENTVSVAGETLDEDAVNVTLGAIEFDVVFLEVPGTFAGGQIIQAGELETNPQYNSRGDFSGDAVTIDPAFLAPEPGSIGMGGMGLAILAGSWWRRRYSIRASRLEPARADIVQKTN